LQLRTKELSSAEETLNCLKKSSGREIADLTQLKETNMGEIHRLENTLKEQSKLTENLQTENTTLKAKHQLDQEIYTQLLESYNKFREENSSINLDHEQMRICYNQSIENIKLLEDQLQLKES
jgi:hypothetical protein